MVEILALEEQIRHLHRPIPTAYGIKQCEECASLCHSRSGLYCDQPDAQYPCATIRVLDEYKEEYEERSVTVIEEMQELLTEVQLLKEKMDKVIARVIEEGKKK